MKKTFITFLVLLSGLIFSQDKKWIIVKEDAEKIIYIDSKNIQEVDNKINIWSMILKKSLRDTDELGRRIGKIKIQYLFNATSQKYAEIGSITYDEIGRMIKNNTNQNINELQPGRFSKSISSDEEVKLVFNKALELLGRNKINNDVYSYKDLKTQSEADTLNSTRPEAIPVRSAEDTLNIVANETTKPLENAVKKDTLVIENEEKSEPVQQETEKIEAAVPEKPELVYDANNEKIVKGTIFTDGKLFIIQKSSWKEQVKAQAEMEKLKNKGENSFITEAKIPGKGTWYRVRVGYFNSLREAELYLNNR